MTPLIYLGAYLFLPGTWNMDTAGTGATGTLTEVSRWMAFICVGCGLWGGLLIGFITEYYTSYAYGPTQLLSESCLTGAATNII